MQKKEYLESLYQQLQWLADHDICANAWGNESDKEQQVSEELVSVFFDFLNELYEDCAGKIEWVFMYLQIYDWQSQSYHEGVMTYYENLYQSDEENGIKRLSDCLHKFGYEEVAKWYDYGMFEYSLYPGRGYTVEQNIRAREIDEWIQCNEEPVWCIYKELLFEHRDELFQMVLRREKDGSSNEEEQSDRRTIHFNSCIHLCMGNTEPDKTEMPADFIASQMDDKLISELAAAKEVRKIQTAGYFSKDVLRLLNEKVFSVREDIAFRIYGMKPDQICDLQYFACMDQVRTLIIDYLKDVEHAESFAQLKKLTALELELSERKDYSFVRDLPAELSSLTINIKEKEYVFYPEWLLRFQKLQSCFVGNYQKHLELVTRTDDVRELILYEMDCPSVEVLKRLAVSKIVIHKKQIKGLEVLGQLSDLKELELVRVSDSENLNFLNNQSLCPKVIFRG